MWQDRRRPFISTSADQNPPRTLFPGGYKRPEIKLPNLVLRLSSDEVFRDNKAVLDVIDDAVADRVGILVLTGGGGSGKRLYEAACLLKSVIRERAYFLIGERVDIAAAVKIPIFVIQHSFGYGTSFTKSSDLLRSGASGVVISVDELNLFKEDDLNKHFFREYASRNNVKVDLSSSKLFGYGEWLA